MLKIAILDACVLYPAHLRDYLLYLAQQKLYKPKWSNEINEEWIRNVIKNRPDLTSDRLNKVSLMMNDIFPQANVKDFENLMDTLNLPDPDDVHVLAAAIHSYANFIITYNIKDFPDNELAIFGIEAIHPDVFLASLIKDSPLKATVAFANQLDHLKNPPISARDVLEKFRNTNLPVTADLLENLL